jgi:DNA ligase-1
MNNREFVMLAGTYNPEKHTVANWFVSKKLDGQRAFWDGGISRGLMKKVVPWANNEKDQRYREQPISTGLWTRYGNVIHAPDWFLDQLPLGVFLDGELYIDRGKFQETRRIISTLEPGPGWYSVRYHVFDSPSPSSIFQHGKINCPNFQKIIVENDCFAFYREHQNLKGSLALSVPRFDEALVSLMQLKEQVTKDGVLRFLNQIRLPPDELEAQQQVSDLLDNETNLGGEGLMLRAPSSVWIPCRYQKLLKVKKFKESEGIIAGYITGQGKYQGMMGAIIVHWMGQDGKVREFQLSGFTDEERELLSEQGKSYAQKNTGTILLGLYECKHFQRGKTVRFKYRELTDDGFPKEARYWR